MKLAVVWKLQFQNKDEEGTNNMGLEDVAKGK
jgi:hypothetical protein